MSNLTVSLPPTLPGSPLLGNALQFLRDPISLLKRGQREYGNIFSFRLGNQPAVALVGPEYSRFFFEQTDKLLSMRGAYPFFISMFSEQTYFFAKPEEYREQRNIILPCFQGKKMANYVDVMTRTTAEFMARLGPSGQCDLTTTLGPLVMNVAAAAFLGEDFRRRLGDEFFGVFRDFSGGMEVVLPLWLPLPRLLRSKRAKAKIKQMLQTTFAVEPADLTVIDDIMLAYAAVFAPGEGHLVSAGTGSIGLHLGQAGAQLVAHQALIVGQHGARA